MFILYVRKSFVTNYRVFDTIAAAKKFYDSLELDDTYLATIESDKLDGPILLGGDFFTHPQFK
jgi:hypothetical protein